MKGVATAMGAVALALVAAIVALTPRDPPQPLPRVAAVEPAAPTSIKSPLLDDVVGSSSKKSQANTEDEWSPSDSLAVAARRLRDAKDKRAFYDRALAVGGSAYLFMAREASTQCIDVTYKGMVEVDRNIATSIRQDDPQYAKRVAAYRSIFEGCGGFETRRPTREEWSKLHSRLAAEPDLVGMAFRRFRWDEGSYQEAVRLLRELFMSDDPYLIELAGQRLQAHQNPSIDGKNWTRAKNDAIVREAAAWEWALCELGGECGPDSRFGRKICGWRGVCEWSDLDDVAQRVFATNDPAPPRERKDEIVTAIRARDWAKLGL